MPPNGFLFIFSFTTKPPQQWSSIAKCRIADPGAGCAQLLCRDKCAPVPEVSTQFIYLLWHDWQLAYAINQSAYKNCKRIPRGERKFAFKCEQSQVNMMKEEPT